MASKTQICNLALSRLGASTITSLTDGTTEAKLCNTFFNDLADRAMIQGSWASTIRRVELNLTTTEPAFGYANAFQLPTSPKCLKVLSIDEDYPGSIDYRIEGTKLLTDEGSIYIRYIAQLTNTEDYGTLLTEAIEVLLASYLALPITGDKNAAQSLKEEYHRLVTLNLGIDGQQGSKEQIISSDLIEVR